VFSVEERDRVRDRVLEMADGDARIVSAAIVGSLADGSGDRWSDVDVSLGVDDGASLDTVLDDWTADVFRELDGVRLFDLPAGPTVYRVFLLPETLQLDLSFTSASEFRQASPRFRLVFGSHRTEFPPAPSAHELVGWAVVFALAARASIERGRLWQAEHSVSAVRDNVLSLACLRHDLPTRFGKGVDELPEDVLRGFDGGLVRSLERDELVRALGRAVNGLLRESVATAPDLAAQIEPALHELRAAWA
jgi:predicted nucleotidyltransferase